MQMTTAGHCYNNFWRHFATSSHFEWSCEISTWSMSYRRLRKSTTDVRRYYHKNTQRLVDGVSLNQRSLEEIRRHDMPGEGDAQPHGANPPPPDPQGQAGQAGTNQVPGPLVPQPGAVPPGPTTPKENDGSEGEGINERLKNIEEMFKEWKERRSTSSRRSTRASRSRTPSGAQPAPRSPARAGSQANREQSTRTTRPRTRTRTRSRSRSHHRRRSSSRQSRRSSSRRYSGRSHRSDSRSRSGRRSRHTGSRSRSTHRRHDTVSPSRCRQRSTSSTRLARALDSQYPEMGRPKSKPLPRSGAALEPYRNLPPDIRKRASRRRSRRDLLFPEHMCGFLYTILKSVDTNSEIYTAIQHAAQVAEDAATLCWSDVREWSQTCLSRIDDGTSSWNDPRTFERDRTKLSWVRGRSKEDLKIPCHEHNTSKCSESSTHYSEGIAWLHTCAICFYGIDDDDTSHIARRCKGKAGVRSARDEGRRDNRWRNNQPTKKDNKQEPNNCTKN